MASGREIFGVKMGKKSKGAGKEAGSSVCVKEKKKKKIYNDQT